MKSLLLLATASLVGLGACASYGYHDAGKAQAAGVNMSASTGFTAGYLGATLDHAPVVGKDGKPLSAPDTCARKDAVNTFANMNSKASASASNVPTSAAGITSPQVAIATGDTTANGGPSIIAAAALTANPADAIAAYCDNAGLPAAQAGSVVRDGVAPK